MNYKQINLLLQSSGNETFYRNQNVICENQDIDKVYVIMSGEFEFLRRKKNEYKLMDPITLDKFKSGDRMDSYEMSKYMPFMDEVQNPKRFNNSLYHGERGQAGPIKILIAGIGQLIGWEDAINKRQSSITVRCISNVGTLLYLDSKRLLEILMKDRKLLNMISEYVTTRDSKMVNQVNLS